jgi:ribosome biogenesis protein Tsr3
MIPCMSSFAEACILTGCLDDLATYRKERIYCVDCTWKQTQVVTFTVSYGVSLNGMLAKNSI